MKISVVIPNFNGQTLLERFLPLLYKSLEYTNLSYEIIVVDDCSTDDSVSFLKQNYNEITLIEKKVNEGFGLTANAGIMRSSGDYLLLLNSDISLSESYISDCLEPFKKEDLFAVMGIANDDSSHPQTGGILYRKGFFKIRKVRNTSDAQTHFVSGANAIFDTKKLKELGGFNPIYSPYYYEDDDLSFRALQKGWKSLFLKDAHCFHLGSHTIKNNCNKNKVKQIYFRNKLIFNYLYTKSPKNVFLVKTFLIDVLPQVFIGKFWMMKSFRNCLTKVRAILFALVYQAEILVN